MYGTELGVLPDHIYVVARGSIPQTSSGKLQRNKCRHRLVNGTFDVHFNYDNRARQVVYCK